MSVLITGANGGLGGAVCRAFMESGASVIGVARSWTEKMPFLTLAADLTNPGQCDAAMAEALRHGPLDALVHLMGGFSGGTAVAGTSDEAWDGMMNLNLRAAFLTIRAALKPMLEARRGRIVAIASRAAVEPMPGFAAYAVSKAALVALIRNVAAEVKDSGVTANAVLPSIIDTPPNRKAMPQSDFSKWVAPESIARALVWLVSEQASGVNGAVIPMYGRA